MDCIVLAAIVLLNLDYVLAMSDDLQHPTMEQVVHRYTVTDLNSCESSSSGSAGFLSVPFSCSTLVKIRQYTRTPHQLKVYRDYHCFSSRFRFHSFRDLSIHRLRAPTVMAQNALLMLECCWWLCCVEHVYRNIVHRCTRFSQSFSSCPYQQKYYACGAHPRRISSCCS